MTDNKDIAILAKKVYEFSTLPVAELEARKWEILLILGAVYSSATKAGVDQANADKDARWGDKIREEGILSLLHPKWHLRTDDGKPPAARYALASAFGNPHRDLRTRYTTLSLIPPADRGPLTDLVRALNAAAFDGATTDAKVEYSCAMGRISKTWTKDPWLTMLPHGDAQPAILTLIDNQSETNDGSIFDKDASDDPYWATAIREWDIDFLRDNPLATFYTRFETAATKVVDTAGDVADSSLDAAKALAKVIAWAPYVLAGIGTLGLTTYVLMAASRHAAMPAAAPAGAWPPWPATSSAPPWRPRSSAARSHGFTTGRAHHARRGT